MPTLPDPATDTFLRPIIATLEAEARPVRPPPQQPALVVPFVTISREAGAGGRSLASLLVEHLNKMDPSDPPWTGWDRELVEKVATDHHIPESLIQSLEESRRTWFHEFLDGLSFSDERPPADEFKVYRRVAATIRALAQIGRTVIVGRGGVFLTAKMPGGVHIRLVAPLEHRVAHMAELLKVSLKEAAAQVQQIEHDRQVFYRHYWPGRRLLPELFTLTINTAALDDQDLVECITPLVLARYQPRHPKRRSEAQL